MAGDVPQEWAALGKIHLTDHEAEIVTALGRVFGYELGKTDKAVVEIRARLEAVESALAMILKRVEAVPDLVSDVAEIRRELFERR